MSYDFRLCLPVEGLTREEVVARDLEALAETEIDAAAEALRRRVADALLKSDPLLEEAVINFEKVAEHEGMTIEEARKKFRWIELNPPEDDTLGLQIILFDDEASITVPYWHEGENSTAAFERIWGYLKVMEAEGGYFTYDPQLDVIFDLADGFDAQLQDYLETMIEVKKRLAPWTKKRWWEFWKKPGDVEPKR